MRNIKLIIEYEGTNYSGWQWQNTSPSIQGAIMDALKELTGEDLIVSGASRTDAGVHAFGQVACFKTESRLSTYTFMQGLNAKLPGDIIIKEASEVALDFDPRRKSKQKTYVYKILNRDHPSAVYRKFSWFVFRPLDRDLMREGALHMIGEKNFSSFEAAESDSLHSIREVLSVDIHDSEEGLLIVEVKGTAFLRHMVRIMVGTLVELGKGRLKPDDIRRIIEARDRTAAHMTAPPQGLFLVKIDY
ncbi:MAG: tRNA pseudouridine(38-40) synthase TruA [Deltaproteobacteria bacterium]|nr:tRNA pseudouridine(38-40) synthase TruA [Deltaproteobacteria bacterium]